MNFAGLILIVVGLLCAGASVFNCGWVSDHRQGSLWVLVFGRNGARIFYGVVGIAVIVVGVLATLGVVEIGAKKRQANHVPTASISWVDGDRVG